VAMVNNILINMQVVKITEQQKDLLIGQMWEGVTFFNPTKDAENQWFVSQEEVNGCNKSEFQWLKTCELIEHNPVIVNIHF
jgi:hypothetical protein